MDKLYKEEHDYWFKKLFKNAVFKGGSAPSVDYGAINRAQEQKRQINKFKEIKNVCIKHTHRRY